MTMPQDLRRHLAWAVKQASSARDAASHFVVIGPQRSSRGGWQRFMNAACFVFLKVLGLDKGILTLFGTGRDEVEGLMRTSVLMK